MSQVIMLTKNDCPQCNQLKMFLKFALNNKYEADIKLVNKENEEVLFQELVKTYDIKSTPALIAEDHDVLRVFGPTATQAFLEKHIGKK